MGDATLCPQGVGVGERLVRRVESRLDKETPLGRLLLFVAIGVSVLVWGLGAGLALSGAGWFGAPAEIADSVVSGLAVAAGVVGTFAALLLATSAPRRRRWLLLGAGLFFVVAGEAADSIRAVVVATGGGGTSSARAGLADVFAISALGLLETAALGMVGLSAERRSSWRASVLVPAGSAFVVLAFWATLDLAGGPYRARAAGALLLLSAASGLAIGIWRRHGHLDRVEREVALAVFLLAESGAAATVGGTRSWLGIVGSALLRATAVLACTLCLSAELLSRLSARRRRLERALERADRLRRELRHRELDWRGSEHELRAALLVVRSGIELLERTIGFLGGDPRLDEAVGYLRTGASSIGSLLWAPTASPGRAEDLRRVVETEVGAACCRGVPARLRWSVGSWTELGVVAADLGALGRVLRELLQNAERHVPGAPVTVQVLWPTSAEIVLRVEDSGPGVPRAVVERLASRRSEKPGEGTPVGAHGLGLMLVRSLAESVGGSMSIGCRADGAGTRVDVHWPIWSDRACVPLGNGTAPRPEAMGVHSGPRTWAAMP